MLGVTAISIIAVSASVFLIDMLYPLLDPRVQLVTFLAVLRDLFRYNPSSRSARS